MAVPPIGRGGGANPNGLAAFANHNANNATDMYLDPIREFLHATTSSSCSGIGQIFEQLVPRDLRFQVALQILWPSLASNSSPLAERIQAAYLLYHLYAQYNIGLNPFKTAFEEVIDHEKSDSNHQHDNAETRSDPPALILVAVIENILNGKGLELDGYSPINLASGTPAVNSETISPRSLASSSSGSSGPVENDENAHVQMLLREAPERILSISEQKILARKLPSFEFTSSIYEDLPYIIAQNAAISFHVLSRLIATSAQGGQDLCFPTLARLRPTLANFDLFAKLLQDPTPIVSEPVYGTTVAESVRAQALGSFLESCELEIEDAEQNEGPVVASDSPCALAIQHLCRFCSSLLRLGILLPTMDAEIAQVLRFSLRFSRYKEANALYRTITSMRNGIMA